MSKQVRASASFQVESTAGRTSYSMIGTTQSSSMRNLPKHSGVIFKGHSSAGILTAQAPQGSAAYVGLDRLTGRLRGRSGSSVLVHAVPSRDQCRYLCCQFGNGRSAR
jgi:hypothetical protein